MSDDFRLLLDTVAIEGPARFDGVAVAAEWMPPQDDVHAPLMLPDVDQFVDQVALIADLRAGEAIAIAGAFGMKVDVAARSHRDPARLEQPPFSTAYPNGLIVDCISENASGKYNFGFCKRALISEGFKAFVHAVRFILAGLSFLLWTGGNKYFFVNH